MIPEWSNVPNAITHAKSVIHILNALHVRQIIKEFWKINSVYVNKDILMKELACVKNANTLAKHVIIYQIVYLVLIKIIVNLLVNNVYANKVFLIMVDLVKKYVNLVIILVKLVQIILLAIPVI